MPIFEYECEKCELTFEKLVRSAQPAEPIACPGCGSKKVEQLYSAFSGRTKSASGATRSPSREIGAKEHAIADFKKVWDLTNDQNVRKLAEDQLKALGVQ